MKTARFLSLAAIFAIVLTFFACSGDGGTSPDNNPPVLSSSSEGSVTGTWCVDYSFQECIPVWILELAGYNCTDLPDNVIENSCPIGYDKYNLYCDYGAITQWGGGCFEMRDAYDCNLEWGEIVEVCGDYPTPSSSSTTQNSSSSSLRLQSSSSQEQMVFCEHLKNQSGSVIRVCEELSLGVCNSLANVGQIVSSCIYEYMTDSRNGNIYRTIKIGTQTWMAENLDYYMAGSVCYDNLASNCTEKGGSKYGRLYNWVTAMALPSSCGTSNCSSSISAKHRGICPVGWHIPSNDDWGKLFSFLEGMGETAARAYMYTNFATQFGGGGYPNGSFGDAGYYIHLWKAEDIGIMSIASSESNNYESNIIYDFNKNFLFNVRCIKD